jgi:hypothetical protein
MTSESEIGPRHHGSPIHIDTFAALLKHEKEIVERINAMPNGGALFLIHPFLAMQDAGVELSARAREEIMRTEPRVGALSPVPYKAMKTSRAKQNYRVRIRGLFRHC